MQGNTIVKGITTELSPVNQGVDLFGKYLPTSSNFNIGQIAVKGILHLSYFDKLSTANQQGYSICRGETFK